MFLTETYHTETRAHVGPNIGMRISIKNLAHSLHDLISNIKKGCKSKHQFSFTIHKKSNKLKKLHGDKKRNEFIPTDNISGTTLCDDTNFYYNSSDTIKVETVAQSELTIKDHDDSDEKVTDIEFEDPYTTYGLLDEPVFFDEEDDEELGITTKATKRGDGSNMFCPARNFNFQFERI
jgi:hypothetical protein